MPGIRHDVADIAAPVHRAGAKVRWTSPPSRGNEGELELDGALFLDRAATEVGAFDAVVGEGDGQGALDTEGAGGTVGGGRERDGGQQIKRQQRLHLYTRANRLFLGGPDENLLGTLEVGRLGDPAVLDDDYFAVPKTPLTGITVLVARRPDRMRSRCSRVTGRIPPRCPTRGAASAYVIRLGPHG